MEREAQYGEEKTQAKLYTIEQIKAAFWETFHAENFGNERHRHDPDAIAQTSLVWEDFKEKLGQQPGTALTLPPDEP